MEEFNTRLIKATTNRSIFLLMRKYRIAELSLPGTAWRIHEISRTGVLPEKARRELVDFGYWYCPDGRDAKRKASLKMLK